MSLLDAAGVVTGDIWCSGAFSFESPLKDLLDSDEYTTEQLLAEDELLQELRGVHPKLIEYFSTEEAVTTLIRYVILPPEGPPRRPFVHQAVREAVENPKEPKAVDKNESGEIGEGGEKSTEEAEPSPEELQRRKEEEEEAEKDTLYVRYPYMACEVICCEITGIIDTLVSGFVPTEGTSASEGKSSSEGGDDPRPQTILDLFFSMLYDAQAGEIDDYRAGYFDKILSVLFRKQPQALGQYINEGGGRGNLALMKVMFNHLYSHSIMQIVQRLLLPQPPLPSTEEGQEQKEGDEVDADPLEGVEVDDGFGSFRCNWSDSEAALELLLGCLIGGPQIQQIQQDEEKSLSMYQNASEVFITIIQNSPLTSPTLHTLTTDPTLEKLVQAASCLEGDRVFGPYDSRLTCTMNVLESLILQLGGYGSVGTVMYGEEEEGEGLQGEPGQEQVGADETGDEEEVEAGDSGNEESVEGGSEEDMELPSQPQALQQDLASCDTLIEHLPTMLSNLGDLLLYSGAGEWRSPMQFSPQKPQKILGSSRLRIVRLLESLVLLGDPIVDSYLCQSNCLEICLDLFWSFQWCSMLHQSVANLLVHVFEGANARAELQSYFLVNCNLLGRLMDSFWDSNNDAQPISNENSVCSSPPPAEEQDDAEEPNEAPTSEAQDDAEEGRETQQALVQNEVPMQGEQIEAKGSGEFAPPQSFRLGYMGHVIIICQALVHACSNEAGDPSVGGTNSEMNGELEEYVQKVEDAGEEPPEEEPTEEKPAEEEADEEENSSNDAQDKARAADSIVTEETPTNPLILAQLVDTHPLRRRWEDFVQSILETETAIQSTPLGGFPGMNPGMDPLQAHRPGLAEDDEYGDDGAAPPPPRGLLVGGDVIDMDDNDLEVAASMMAGLSMGQAPEGDNRNDDDLLAGIPQQSGDSPQSGGYMFDDPLGDGRFGRFQEDEDSSDEESELSGNTGDSGGAVAEGVAGGAEHASEAPVMDLFAGNFEAFDENQGQGTEKVAPWSDFANFDNAFETAGDPSQDVNDPFTAAPTNGNIDDLFGEVKGRSNLVDDIDDPLSMIPQSDEVAAKVGMVEDEDSSDEEDPVQEPEASPEPSN